jgi:hypothetical protein
MRRNVTVSAFAAAMAILALAFGATAKPWSKGYVVDWMEPATYYAGGPDPSAPGPDCPQGINPETDWVRVLKTTYRSDSEVRDLLRPENDQRKYKAMPMRGPNRENIYLQPEAVPDPGLTQITGAVAYGFDLDGNAKTGGFSSPDGVPGIDNALYRTVGCWLGYRGPPKKAFVPAYVNNIMRAGSFAALFVLSGSDSPEHDDNATVSIYMSEDRLVKDARGDVARDYTFRVNQDPKYTTILQGRIHDGVFETKVPADIRLHYVQPPFALLLKSGRLRMNFRPDGGLDALVGGYVNWRDMWTGFQEYGLQFEVFTRVQMPALYYALARNADGLYDPVSGKNDGLSMAVSLSAVPAFVVEPASHTVLGAANDQ